MVASLPEKVRSPRGHWRLQAAIPPADQNPAPPRPVITASFPTRVPPSGQCNHRARNATGAGEARQKRMTTAERAVLLKQRLPGIRREGFDIVLLPGLYLYKGLTKNVE